MNNIKDHIKWEWEKFSLDILCTSKQNIFSKASEIQNKQFIYKVISEHYEIFNEKEVTVICASDCFIDTIYNRIFLEENNDNCFSEKMQDILEAAHRFAAK